MTKNAQRRRKGKPYNPAATVHDRTSHDLLRNAQVTPVEVDDPYEAGGKIVVLRSTRNDPLADMMAKKQIDQCDYVAGRHWQAAWEAAEIGGIRAIDPSKEAVDGGRLPEILTDHQRRAVVDLNNAKATLGHEGNELIHMALVSGLSMKQISINRRRGAYSEAEHKYVGRRFRECLSSLAVRFGYATRAK